MSANARHHHRRTKVIGLITNISKFSSPYLFFYDIEARHTQIFPHVEYNYEMSHPTWIRFRNCTLPLSTFGFVVGVCVLIVFMRNWLVNAISRSTRSGAKCPNRQFRSTQLCAVVLKWMRVEKTGVSRILVSGGRLKQIIRCVTYSYLGGQSLFMFSNSRLGVG